MRIRSCPAPLLLALAATALSSCATPPDPQPTRQENPAVQQQPTENAGAPGLSRIPLAIDEALQKAAQKPKIRRALVRAQIDEEGKLVRTRMERSSGSAKLDERILAAVRAGRYRPYIVDGKPRRVVVRIPIVIELAP